MASTTDIQLLKFSDVRLEDAFFDSLRDSYAGFDVWFKSKSTRGETAYVLIAGGAVKAFLYLKVEQGRVNDISPPLITNECLKIGTFKIEAHGTKLGERFVKKVFDHAVSRNIRHVYITIFNKHRPLIKILERYGFIEHGRKTTSDGDELVFLKDFSKRQGNILLDYPVIQFGERNAWLMAIKPEWHTKLFPDSILRNENANIVEDISHTNSIHKVYVGCMYGMDKIKPEDVIVIYRITEETGRAWFKSVITSLCVVEEVRRIGSFQSVDEFIEYASPHSVFEKSELSYFYETKKHGTIVRMTYNVALPKRLNMQQLVETVGLDRSGYWGFRKLSREQLLSVITQSRVPDCVVSL
jgi:hypothetical protein